MAAAAKGLVQMGVGIGILTETKVTNDRYSKFLSGYRVLVSKATSPHQGGIGLIWREDHNVFKVKAIQPLTPNLMSFQLVTGNERYYFMGSTSPPTVRRGWTISEWHGRRTPQTALPLSLGTSTFGLRTSPTTGQMLLSNFWRSSTPPISLANFSLDDAASNGEGHAGPSACKEGGSGATQNQIIFWGMSASQRGSRGWHFAHHGSTTWTIGRSSQPSGGGAHVGSSHTNTTNSASLLSFPKGRRLNTQRYSVVLLQIA
jgi:hypothetical protein